MIQCGCKRSWLRLIGWYVGLFSIISFFCACGAITKKIYEPDELRSIMIERTQGRAISNLEVPFEIDPKYVEIAKRAVLLHSSRQNRAVALSSAMFSRGYFGLRFENVATSSANETLRQGYGNCLSLASVFVGLARSIGLDSYYMDASARVNDLEYRKDMTVRLGHITAAAETEHGIWLLDARHLFHVVTKLRLMGDLEAVAHFYNNRGYDLIAIAQQEKTKVDWKKVIEMFSIATQVKPDFYRAWNNMGVAYVRSGRDDLAEICYLKAINEKKFISPFFNLGLLYLSSRDYLKATKYFKTAAKMESDNYNIQYHYGVALLGSGNMKEAEDVFEKAVNLNVNNQKARKFLNKIYLYQKHSSSPTWSQ